MALIDKVLYEIYIWSWIARVEEECYLEARTQIFVVDYLLNELYASSRVTGVLWFVPVTWQT